MLCVYARTCMCAFQQRCDCWCVLYSCPSCACITWCADPSALVCWTDPFFLSVMHKTSLLLFFSVQVVPFATRHLERPFWHLHAPVCLHTTIAAPCPLWLFASSCDDHLHWPAQYYSTSPIPFSDVLPGQSSWPLLPLWLLSVSKCNCCGGLCHQVHPTHLGERHLSLSHCGCKVGVVPSLSAG